MYQAYEYDTVRRDKPTLMSEAAQLQGEEESWPAAAFRCLPSAIHTHFSLLIANMLNCLSGRVALGETVCLTLNIGKEPSVEGAPGLMLPSSQLLGERTTVGGNNPARLRFVQSFNDPSIFPSTP